jgi:ABC-type branched-subunit amino acid transport system substrate-binding protein
MDRAAGCHACANRGAVRTVLVALQVLVLAAARAQGQGGCPNHSVVFPEQHWSKNASCSVVTVEGRRSPGTPLQNPLWEDGLRMYANFTNAQGGLRLGKGQIGYVEVRMQDAASPNHLGDDYKQLCKDATVDVLLAPVASDVALDVLKELKAEGGCTKPFIAADTSASLFQQGATNLWSVEGWNATQKGGAAIDFLHALGARTFTIVAKARDEYKDIASALRTAIYSYSDSRMLESREWRSGVSMINEIANDVEKKKPDVFLAVGDLDMLEALLAEFKGQKYAPDAAVFMEGLAASPHMVEQSYTTTGCSQCFVYNQWMGTVPWSEQMPYHGRNNWTAIQPVDPYGDRASSQKDSRDHRYMGSAADFAKYARSWLLKSTRTLRDPDAYHAKAFASMLLLQMAAELTGPNGWGLSKAQLGEAQTMREAAAHLSERSGVQTFWGTMKLRADGFNEGFEMGIAQFQGHNNVPTLVGPAVFGATGQAVYPAIWPCNVFDNCDVTEGWSLWDVLGALLVGALSVCVVIGCYVKERNSRWVMKTLNQIPFLHRPSVFESRSTDSLLLDGNVEAAWYTSANVPDSMLDPAPDSAPPLLPALSRTLRRQHSGRAPVLFRDKDISNLRPRNWRDQNIGKGSYGTVYRATWEGKEVAVKELKIPEEHDGLTDGEKAAFVQQAKELRTEFLKELKVSCDCKWG